MKNYLLILLLAGSIAITIPSEAQLVAGFKGGINYAGLSNHNGGKRISGHGGIFIHSAFNAKWHIQSELLYSNEGYKYSIIETIDAGFQGFQETERTVSISNVSVPVMFQYFVSPKYFIEAGPQLSITISATDKAASEKLNVKRSLANTQFGLNAGMGLMISKQAEVYVRYCFGLTDLTLFDDNIDQSRVLQTGILFRLNKKESKRDQASNR
ncbi:MAG: PorT family protein [Chitinophagaceae bacterium]|nr:PorT family protein [Chitinophagaceae bacterium]